MKQVQIPCFPPKGMTRWEYEAQVARFHLRKMREILRRAKNPR